MARADTIGEKSRLRELLAGLAAEGHGGADRCCGRSSSRSHTGKACPREEGRLAAMGEPVVAPAQQTLRKGVILARVVIEE